MSFPPLMTCWSCYWVGQPAESWHPNDFSDEKEIRMNLSKNSYGFFPASLLLNFTLLNNILLHGCSGDFPGVADAEGFDVAFVEELVGGVFTDVEQFHQFGDG